MKFPSLNHLVQTGANVVKRFPFEILSALVGTIAATVNVELKYIDRESENIFYKVNDGSRIIIADLFRHNAICRIEKTKKA